jgi:hypothetical protein
MDWKKIGTGALIALSGAAITYVTTIVIPAMEKSGDAVLLLVAAFASVAVNAIRKAIEAKGEAKTDG